MFFILSIIVILYSSWDILHLILSLLDSFSIKAFSHKLNIHIKNTPEIVLISNMTSPALLSNFSSILSIFYLVNTYAANLLLQYWSVILYKIFGYSVNNKKWFILWRSKYNFFPKRIEFHVLMYRHEEKKYSIVMIIWISV